MFRYPFALWMLLLCVALAPGCPTTTDDDDATDDDDDSAGLEDADGDGLSPAEGDCDDSDASINPLADEVCDARDNDCNGAVDEGFDGDGDGATTCGADGVAGNADDDCDDADPLMNQADADGDGATTCDGDCDDADASSHPDADETCDGADNDCDGVADDVDADGDGFVDLACGGDDCDDTRDDVYPGAAELCDGADNDCNDAIDDVDVDEDGYIDEACEGDDCDDADPAVHPDAEEICDQADNDCDGTIPDDVDADGDGYTLCDGECDDADPAVNPGANELFDDGIDNDCDGRIDVVWDHGSQFADLIAFHGAGEDPSFAAPSAGDLDGDGVDDLVFAGRDEAAPLEPVTYLYLGRAQWPGELDHSVADGQIEGVVDTEALYCELVGDVDDDGFEDAFCDVNGDLCLFPGGAAPWPVGTNQYDAAACVSPDPADVDWVIHAARRVGDLDGDGIDDVLFQYGDVTQIDGEDVDRALSLRLFAGRASWSDALVTESDADIELVDPARLLARLQVADLDGDGFRDLLVCQGSADSGTPTETAVLYGGVGRWIAGMSLADQDARFVGTRTDGSGFRECVRAAGDLDGDGFVDLHLEALEDGDRFLLGDGTRFSGPASMAAYDAELTLPDLAEKQVSATFLDFNDDGYGDVALGLAGQLGYDAATHVYLGHAGMDGLSALWSLAPIRFSGEPELPWGGSYADAAGDVDGDGVTDLVLGSLYGWTGETQWWYVATGFTGPDPGLTDDDGDGYTERDGDCDDSDAARYPGASEPHDFTDWDCDGVIYDPGVDNGTFTANLTVTASAIAGTLVFTYNDASDYPICDHVFDVTGTATAGAYGNECPSCSEQWDLVLTEASHTCSFDPTVFGVAESMTEDFAQNWVTDTTPYGYCIADDCAQYLLDDFIDYWVAIGENPVIWLFGPDLMGVGHPEFIGYLEPGPGAAQGLPADGGYDLTCIWNWLF